MAGRHQRAHKRCVGGDVYRVIGVDPFLFHHGNHHRAHRRHIGHGRARNAAEQGARDDVGHAKPAANMADHILRQLHDAVGNAAVEHQLPREDKKRNGEKGEDIHPRTHALKHYGQRQTFIENRRNRRQANGKGHRHAQNEQAQKGDGQNNQCHDGMTSLPCSMARTCSTENSTIKVPDSTSGRWLKPSEICRIGI